MDINLIRLGNKFLSEELLKEDDSIIEELNNSLFDNDYLLVENTPNSSLQILFVESDDIDIKFSKLAELLIDPIMILYGKDKSSFKMAMDINSYFSIHNRYSLVGCGTAEENAALISEIARVTSARNKVEYTNVALIGLDESKAILNKVDATYFSKMYHINVIKISIEEFELTLKNVKKKPIYRSNIIDNIIENKKDNALFKKYYNAIDYLIDKYQLSGLCFSYPACHDFDYPLAALFNERGYSFILEHDLYSLISLMTLNALSDTAALYGSVLKCDLPEDTVHILTNNVPFNMLIPEGVLNNGNVTLYKIGYDNKLFFTAEGKITSSSEYDGDISVIIKLNDNDLFELFRSPIGGTLAFTYGEYSGSLVAYQNMLFKKNK